jgi:hypothetical protein
VLTQVLDKVEAHLDNSLQVVKSPFWKAFEEYIEKLLDNEINKLIYTQDPYEKSVCQGKAQAYKTILGLKGQV